ncbi:MAG: dTDP-4-dehydrorhamnose reductase [Actinobacteria bacterium]|nr:dTDP-4-dehydrorhamnose reductase [Actinomycetota bacterium]
MGLRIVVTGAGGQLGRELVDAFPAHEMIGLDHVAVDVADRHAVLGAITTLRPDRVVHAAAWTDVDGCEGDPDRAFAVNALGTRHVAEAARLVGAHVVAVSTDYVFSGDADRPYNEWDEPAPVSVYGRSKLAGEREVGPAGTVVRTSWLCGRHGPNFVASVLRLARQHEVLTMVDDQVGCPTLADDLARMVARLTVEARPGVVHVTNQGAVSRYEFAREVLRAGGLDPERVKPIATADFHPARPARRPANSVLDNAVLRLSGVPLLPDFRASLPRLVESLA